MGRHHSNGLKIPVTGTGKDPVTPLRAQQGIGFGDASHHIYPKTRISSLCKMPGAVDHTLAFMFQTYRSGEGGVRKTLIRSASTWHMQAPSDHHAGVAIFTWTSARRRGILVEFGNSLMNKRVIVATCEIAAVLPSLGHVGCAIHIQNEGLQLKTLGRSVSNCGDAGRHLGVGYDSISYEYQRIE